MGVPKGTDNFKGHRAAKQKGRAERLDAELEKARRRKVQYPDRMALVLDMAERMQVHRTTLTRNPLYLGKLLDFLAGQAGASTLVADKDAPPDLLRAKLVDADMEIGRLSDSLAKAEARALKATSGPLLNESAAHTAFVDTVWALRAVLDRVNGDGEVYEVDFERCEIRDMSSAPGRRVIVSGRRLRPFIDALRRLKGQEE